jgi:hypothetical protein
MNNMEMLTWRCYCDVINQLLYTAMQPARGDLCYGLLTFKWVLKQVQDDAWGAVIGFSPKKATVPIQPYRDTLHNIKITRKK